MTRSNVARKPGKTAGSGPGSPRRRRVAPTLSARRIALLIGNGRILEHGKAVVDIPGVDKDLKSLATVLGDSEAAGFEIRALMEPKLIDVRREIARAAADAGADDTLLVYYSGTSTLGHDSLLYLPVIDSDVKFLEATCLDSEYVLSCMRQSACRRQLLMMDGCHSGAFFTSNRGIPNGFCAIMACGPDQMCGCDDEGGFFTRLVVEGLRGAAADRDGDGTVTTDELFRYVLPRAAKAGIPTTPQMWSWNLPEPIPLVRVRQRVFLSYRRSDSKVADMLTKRLEDAGYGVWIDRSDIRGGSRWRDEIAKGLEQADAMITLVSRAALESDEVYKELAMAVEARIPIIPINLDASPLHGWYKEHIGGIQNIMRDGKNDGVMWQQLEEALRSARMARGPKLEPKPAPRKAKPAR